MFSSKQEILFLKDKKYLDNKGNFVRQMFENMANEYDHMNEIISFGLNLNIKKRAIMNIPIKSGAKILDVCTGTGDMAITLADYLNKSCQITAIDFSKNMLEIASQKAKGLNNIEFIYADALNLPFDDNTFDISLISYGLRNLENLRKGLLEMQRVTKKDGYVVNLDFGKSKTIYNKIFAFYFFNIIPLFRILIHKDFTAYRYIPISNDNFPAQNELISIFKQLGFREVKNYDFVLGTIAQQVAKV